MSPFTACIRLRYEGQDNAVDMASREQALQISPDGKFAGPVTCSARHRVNGKGIPVQLQNTEYYNDCWAAVVLLHSVREGDQKLPVNKLMEKSSWKNIRKKSSEDRR
jgi:hypothetical protein